MSWRRQMHSLLFENREETTAYDMYEAYFGDSSESSRNTCDYFFYRFAQPRYLSTLATTAMIDPDLGPILDLGCGSGHITRHLQFVAPQQPIVGVDNNFFMLFMAKNWVAPGALYVFCDIESPLPFEDRVFGSVLCSNTFHFLADMASCKRELRRVTKEEGLFILTSVRNSLRPHVTPNNACSPRQYAGLWGDLNVALLPDDVILSHYLRGNSPNFSASASWEDLEAAPLISLVATAGKGVLREAAPLTPWPHARGSLKINPLYTVTSGPNGSALLQRSFPSEFFADENFDATNYLPETVTVSATALRDISTGKLSEETSGLVDRCVFVSMPPGYVRPPGVDLADMPSP